MENSEQRQEKTRLDELREKIDGARARIESEFTRTENSWLECFGSSVFVIETYLSSPKLEALLSREQYKHALQRMDGLKEKLFELKKQYPDKNTVLPDNIKESLLQELDIVRWVE